MRGKSRNVLEFSGILVLFSMMLGKTAGINKKVYNMESALDCGYIGAQTLESGKAIIVNAKDKDTSSSSQLGCTINFLAAETDSTIRVDFESFTINTCDVKLYLSGDGSGSMSSYSCGDNPSSYSSVGRTLTLTLHRTSVSANQYNFQITITAVGGTDNTADKSSYNMEKYCGEEFSFILEDRYQIKLELNDNYIHDDHTYLRGGTCETKFEAWYSIFSKLMFYFEDLDLDCDKGHLEFYTDESGYRRVPGLDTNICGDTKPQGVYNVDSQYFRIVYVPKRNQKIKDIFSIIITSYADGYCPSYAHECANSRCIDEDLACNGYDSCGDGSGCDMSTGVIVGIVIGSLTGLALIVSIVVCCFCCRKRKGSPGVVQNTANAAIPYSAPNQQTYSQQMYGVNQGTSYNLSQSPYPLAISPSLPPTAPVYDVNQGTQYSTDYVYHPPVSQYSSNNQQPPEGKPLSEYPPKYSELFANTEQANNQTMH